MRSTISSSQQVAQRTAANLGGVRRESHQQSSYDRMATSLTKFAQVEAQDVAQQEAVNQEEQGFLAQSVNSAALDELKANGAPEAKLKGARAYSVQDVVNQQMTAAYDFVAGDGKAMTAQQVFAKMAEMSQSINTGDSNVDTLAKRAFMEQAQPLINTQAKNHGRHAAAQLQRSAYNAGISEMGVISKEYGNGEITQEQVHQRYVDIVNNSALDAEGTMKATHGWMMQGLATGNKEFYTAMATTNNEDGVSMLEAMNMGQDEWTQLTAAISRYNTAANKEKVKIINQSKLLSGDVASMTTEDVNEGYDAVISQLQIKYNTKVEEELMPQADADAAVRQDIVTIMNESGKVYPAMGKQLQHQFKSVGEPLDPDTMQNQTTAYNQTRDMVNNGLKGPLLEEMLGEEYGKYARIASLQQSLGLSPDEAVLYYHKTKAHEKAVEGVHGASDEERQVLAELMSVGDWSFWNPMSGASGASQNQSASYFADQVKAAANASGKPFEDVAEEMLGEINSQRLQLSGHEVIMHGANKMEAFGGPDGEELIQQQIDSTLEIKYDGFADVDSILYLPELGEFLVNVSTGDGQYDQFTINTDNIKGQAEMIAKNNGEYRANTGFFDKMLGGAAAAWDMLAPAVPTGPEMKNAADSMGSFGAWETQGVMAEKQRRNLAAARKGKLLADDIKMPTMLSDKLLVNGHLKEQEPKSGKIYHGKAAVNKVAEAEGELTDVQKHIIMEEGYSTGTYDDTKGISTSGVGQTGQFQGKTFKETFAIMENETRRMVPNLDSLPANAQKALISATYRGTLQISPKTRGLINEGKYKEAEAEYLDNAEYRSKDTPLSIKRRMEWNAKQIGKI